MRFWAQVQPHEHTHCSHTGNVAILHFLLCVTLLDDSRHWPIHCTHSDQVHFFTKEEKNSGYEVIYQQDVARPNCSDRPLEFFRRYFHSDRIISQRTDFPWPPCSPDLSPPDNFLQGYLKERIYDNYFQILAALKNNTRKAVRRISADIIGRVMENVKVRVGTVICQIFSTLKNKLLNVLQFVSDIEDIIFHHSANV